MEKAKERIVVHTDWEYGQALDFIHGNHMEDSMEIVDERTKDEDDKEVVFGPENMRDIAEEIASLPF